MHGGKKYRENQLKGIRTRFGRKKDLRGRERVIYQREKRSRGCNRGKGGADGIYLGIQKATDCLRRTMPGGGGGRSLL